MILLDTNVVSEPLRPLPDAAVIAWIDAQLIETFYLSAISLAELRFGIALLPKGKRRDVLESRLDQQLLLLFSDRIISFDLMASRFYGAMMAQARGAGFAVDVTDGMIAATAAAHGLTVASRDTAPFISLGLKVINPWQK